MDRLKKRAEFLACAKGVRSARRGFVVQGLARGDDGGPRIGFTVTKKVGGAVERNRIRRRLREAARLSGAAVARAGTDYVIVGRRDALSLGFDVIRADLEGAFRQLGRSLASARTRPGDTAPARPASDASPGGSR